MNSISMRKGRAVGSFVVTQIRQDDGEPPRQVIARRALANSGENLNRHHNTRLLTERVQPFTPHPKFASVVKWDGCRSEEGVEGLRVDANRILCLACRADSTPT